MQLNTYVNFRGTCEEAFKFYEQHLGGKITMLTRHGQQPAGVQRVPDWDGKVMHGRIDIGGTELFGADVPTAEPMRSAYLSLTLTSASDAERIYAALSDGGQIFMKMEETFFATRFAMLRDKFGVSWMLMVAKN
ncbi:MAG TPA: VOC family protein [Vicinamibacterales bacterium]|nr:VOC family protein [Vicinamibacterales bacterium]